MSQTTPRDTRRQSAKTTRRHGYRGYGSGLGKDSASYGGRVHWGRGFAGVDIPEGGSDALLEPGLFTDEEKEKASKSKR